MVCWGREGSQKHSADAKDTIESVAEELPRLPQSHGDFHVIASAGLSKCSEVKRNPIQIQKVEV